ncbi:sigma factor, ECF family [Aliarcobacter lanthieri]|nr:sigma factor, ECF family [Aliarcobacter lanthieri]
MTGDKELSLEIVQETYAKTLERQKEINIENERAFLYKVARNLTFDYSKKNKNKQFIEYDDERNFCSKEEEPDEVLMETKKDELLLEALESLPPYLKEVFVLHFFDGLDKKKIAVILNINVNTVQKYVIRATTQLTKYIEDKDWN